MTARPTTVSDHAVERYRERHRPDLQPDAARVWLETLLPWASHVEDERGTDQSIWEILVGRARVLIVVAAGEVRTVLPKNSKKPEGRR